MMIKCRTDGQSGDVSQAVTIVPRLGYSAQLLSGIVRELKSQRVALRASNQKLLRVSEGDDAALRDAIDLERTVAFSLEVLSQVLRRVRSVSGISSIPKTLPLAIPAIRTVSAQLHGIMPACSQKLCELSVHLGSIVLDSATIATAKFDFGQSNSESALFCDEVKLMVDSKINKQYHNLDFLKQ